MRVIHICQLLPTGLSDELECVTSHTLHFEHEGMSTTRIRVMRGRWKDLGESGRHTPYRRAI